MIQRLAALAAAMMAATAWAGAWLTPDFSPGAEPAHKPVPLYWFTVSESPLIYRIELAAPPAAGSAAALARSAGYLYVYVDDRLIYSFAPKPEDKQKKTAAIPADPDRVHEIDLSALCTPGRHVLAVSAPREGFVLDGAFYEGGKALAKVGSSADWKLAKLAPTAILEDEGILKPGYSGLMHAVKAGEAWQQDAADANTRLTAERTQRRDADRAWRADLLSKRGLYIADHAARGFAGPQRLGPITQNVTPDNIDQRTTQARDADDALSLALARQALARPDATREQIEKTLGQPLPPLNQSRQDRLGWIEHPSLSDSDISRWGIRINPANAPAVVNGPQWWRFLPDPKEVGVEELRHTFGYNIDNQWPVIDATKSWTDVKQFAEYKGWAWYRGLIDIPADWVGHRVQISIPIAGAATVYLNDTRLEVILKNGRLVGVAPAAQVYAGGQNLLAIRCFADGKERGLVAPVKLSCPTLADVARDDVPPVDVLATPLSPCALVTLPQGKMTIVHDRFAWLLHPLKDGGCMRETLRGQDLTVNWLLLYTREQAGSNRVPILLVFENRPAEIAMREDRTSIKTRPGARIVMVRPWTNAPPAGDKLLADPSQPRIAFWSRAALAIPRNFQCLTRIATPGQPIDNISIDHLPAGPILEHTYVYDHLILQDDWNTTPLKIAPLPAFCSRAIDLGRAGMVTDRAVRKLHDGTPLAAYRGVPDSDIVTYSYPVEPWPRLQGFTSFMFSPVDAGVPGNAREVQLLARAGGNSFRPQHNWSDEKPPKGMFPPDEARTRVQVLADYANAAGLNCMNNIDQTLGLPREAVRNDYAAFTEKLFGHYARLVPQLAGRPFHAVAYDLVNEPFDHQAPAYNAAMKELTRRIRAIDKTHLLCIEPPQAWGAIQQLELVQPTGDPLTLYSFHDYNFRLQKPDDRWPTLDRDIRSIHRLWMPAFLFQVRHNVPMHCGEYGGFASSTFDSDAQLILMNDFFRIFEQFGLSHHYYSGRELYPRLADGSLCPSNVVRAFQSQLR